MAEPVVSLSLPEARKLALLSQGIPPVKQKGKAADATLSALEHLGYIQIDTISVVQRAHHHTLWNRNPRYHPSHLHRLVEEGQVFEYWSHAAAYLPMKDYRYTLPRKKDLEKGNQNHWYDRDEKLMAHVIDRITWEGPLMARDFVYRGEKIGDWESKPAKQALENLFMQGRLMVVRRENFHKVYDLSKRVIPDEIDTTIPCPEEYARFLIFRYLKANGLGQTSEITYLLKNIKPHVISSLKEMVLSGELQQVEVRNKLYYAIPSSLELLNRPLVRKKLKILSPFDNLIIQRKRTQELFGFDYLLECYTPPVKRRYGYFSLPLLWDGKLTARMDCRADRKQSVFHIIHLSLENEIVKIDSFLHALHKELELFMEFNQCTQLELHKTSPGELKDLFFSKL